MKTRTYAFVALALATTFISASLAQTTNSTPSRGPANRGTRGGGPPRVGPVHPGFNPALPTVWLVGDSTVKNGRDTGSDGLWGWGNPIAAWFDKTKINVENQALGGTSSRSFITSKLWDAVVTQVKPGDFVIMQFGHNDSGSTNMVSARASLKGSGEKTETTTNTVNGNVEVVHTYGWYLCKYIADTKAKGGIPIVCSLIPRNDWTGGKVQRANTSFGLWAREAAQAKGAFFVDLNSIIADRYDKLGQEAVKPFFPNEHTHTGWDGAVLNAECVIEGIKKLKDCPLNRYLAASPERPKLPALPVTRPAPQPQ